MVKLKKVIYTPRTSDARRNLHKCKMPSAERLFKASKGYNLEDLKSIEGKYLLVRHFSDESGDIRLKIIDENFTQYDGEYSNGSIKYNALYSILDICAYNLNAPDYFCPECGKSFDNCDHHCDDLFCLDCGKVIRKAEEKRHQRCEACQRQRLRKRYGYHRRPNRNQEPEFERPHLRQSYCHISPEFEVPHRERYSGFTAGELAKMSDVLNPDCWHPFAYGEEDGSLPGGVEYIPQPTTLKGWNNLRPRLEKFYKTANDLGAKFATENGLHFHIDRTYFGEPGTEERARASLMVAYMIYSHYDFWKAISRRENDCFGYAEGKKCNGIGTAYEAIRNPSHYDGVNVGGSETIELRFFGGHIDNVDDFLACADIVNAIARWAKASSLAQAEKATPAQIVRYINDPANVKRFCEYQTPRGFANEESNRLKREFIARLNEKI